MFRLTVKRNECLNNVFFVCSQRCCTSWWLSENRCAWQHPRRKWGNWWLHSRVCKVCYSLSGSATFGLNCRFWMFLLKLALLFVIYFVYWKPPAILRFLFNVNHCFFMLPFIKRLCVFYLFIFFPPPSGYLNLGTMFLLKVADCSSRRVMEGNHTRSGITL